MQISILSILLGLLAVISQAIPTTKNEHIGGSPSLPNGQGLAARDNYAHPANESNSLYAWWNCNWTALDPKECHNATNAMNAIMKNAGYQVQGVSCLNATVGSTIAFFCAEPTVEDLTETFPRTC
ncbi:hypothetical protein PG999_001845 [Apiospora kogelbergensis]|uniref:Uncharacterized protein n=1 Tax=Apiospora kogelbergensis TaxID=1337665 RepID=A0AAW0R6P2_9PEZI